MKTRAVVTGGILALGGVWAISAVGQAVLTGPAEVPPLAFQGSEYVDSEGCVFIRAGVNGNIVWVPRVTRDRQSVCGYPPTFTTAQLAAMAEGSAPVASAPQAATTTSRATTPTTTTRQTARRPVPNDAYVPPQGEGVSYAAGDYGSVSVRDGQMTFGETDPGGDILVGLAGDDFVSEIGAQEETEAGDNTLAGLVNDTFVPAGSAESGASEEGAQEETVASTLTNDVFVPTLSGGSEIALADMSEMTDDQGDAGSMANDIYVPTLSGETEIALADMSEMTDDQGDAGGMANDIYVPSSGEEILTADAAMSQQEMVEIVGGLLNDIFVPVSDGSDEISEEVASALASLVNDIFVPKEELQETLPDEDAEEPETLVAETETETGPTQTIDLASMVGDVFVPSSGATQEIVVNETQNYTVSGGLSEVPVQTRTAAATTVVTERPTSLVRTGQTLEIGIPNSTTAAANAIPEGYRAAWEDDRLNPSRGPQTPTGDQQMQAVWTNSVPMRLAANSSISDVTALVPFTSSKSVEPAETTGGYIQIGVFGDPANVEKNVAFLNAMGMDAATKDLGTSRIVLAGPFPNARITREALDHLQGIGYIDAFIR